MEIFPLRCLADNYIWMLCDHKLKIAWAVDPGDAWPVLDFVKQFDLELQGILITHHHHDHSGGIVELLENYKQLRIYGSHHSPISQINCRMREADEFECLQLNCRVLEIPGHTLDHLAFVIGKAIFCGDTLFSIGCGKIFEGTASQMYHSLQRISQLPDDTEIYCGHEYTLKNLKFAQLVDPNNQNLKIKFEQIKHLTENNKPTLPSLLKEEKILNPFLRCTELEIIHAVENYSQKKLTDPIEVFFYLRQWKNEY